MSFVQTAIQGANKNYNLSVKYDACVVRIENDEALRQLLDTEDEAPMLIARTLKSTYKNQMNKRLDISDTSLAIEILGHVYPDRVGKTLKSIPLPSPIKNAIDKILERTDVIDCGETNKDSNRWVWDALAKVDFFK